MASITKRPDGRWRARYRDEAGKEHAKHFDRKIDGQRWLDEASAALVTGQFVNPKAGKITFADFAVTAWLPSLDLRPSSRREYEGAVARYVAPLLGSKPISEITILDARGFVTALEQRLGARTVRRIVGHVRAIFRFAVASKVVTGSPFDSVRMRPLVQARRKIPTVADVRAVVASAREPITAVMVQVAAQTGLRSAELRGLCIRDLDLPRRRLMISRQLVPGKVGAFTLGDLKTPASVRTVRLTRDLAETLATFLAVNPPDVANGLLFHESGRPISNSTWDYRIKAAQRRAGVATFRIHDLRHHCASVLIAAGVPVPAITQQLGHASPQVTYGVYAHLLRDHEEAASDAIAAAWALPTQA